MPSSFKTFRARALARPAVRKAYDALAEEFAFLDEVLKARAASGLTQAEVAAKVGTTQSAIARLESGTPKHSPSMATLQRYARALGYRVEVRFVKEQGVRSGAKRRAYGGQDVQKLRGRFAGKTSQRARVSEVRLVSGKG